MVVWPLSHLTNLVETALACRHQWQSSSQPSRMKVQVCSLPVSRKCKWSEARFHLLTNLLGPYSRIKTNQKSTFPSTPATIAEQRGSKVSLETSQQVRAVPVCMNYQLELLKDATIMAHLGVVSEAPENRAVYQSLARKSIATRMPLHGD